MHIASAVSSGLVREERGSRRLSAMRTGWSGTAGGEVLFEALRRPGEGRAERKSGAGAKKHKRMRPGASPGAYGLVCVRSAGRVSDDDDGASNFSCARSVLAVTTFAIGTAPPVGSLHENSRSHCLHGQQHHHFASLLRQRTSGTTSAAHQ